jgi:hypothetical protein
VGKVGVTLKRYVADRATRLDLAMHPESEEDEDRPNGVIVADEKHRFVNTLESVMTNTKRNSRMVDATIA